MKPLALRILDILNDRQGASMAYLQEHLRNTHGARYAEPSIRVGIAALRRRGYGIQLGPEKSCDGQRLLYTVVSSPVAPQRAVSAADGYADELSHD